jgi:hypothetical protein
MLDAATKTVHSLPTEAALESYVKAQLCQRDRLDPRHTPLFRTLISRHGRPAGYLFEVQGPRLLRLSAIWVEPESRILFYDSTGSRYHEARLSEAPEILVEEKPRLRVAA